jgi:hypothetical protein
MLRRGPDGNRSHSCSPAQAIKSPEWNCTRRRSSCPHQLLHRLAQHVAHAEAGALLAGGRQLRFGEAREVATSQCKTMAGYFHDHIGLQHCDRHAVRDFATCVPHGDEQDAIDFAVGHGGVCCSFLCRILIR